MKDLFAIFLCLLILSFSSYPQEENSRYHHPLSKAFGFSLEGGLTVAKTDFINSNKGYMTKASIEYYFPSSVTSAFALKLVAAGLGSIAGDNGDIILPPKVKNFRTNLFIVGGAPEYTISFGNVNPYLLGGLYYLRFDPKDQDGNKLYRNSVGAYDLNELLFTGELGIKFLVSKSFSLNISGATYISHYDNLDDFQGGFAHDVFYSFTAGLTFFIQPERDSDNDGVKDDEDMCPDTPQGIMVDIMGCPIDSDKDGIADYLDKCPDTPEKVVVSNDGCPIDSDKDGVPDYLDKCPDTHVLAKVDKNGCPLDSDNDGIPDYIDRCPGTPAGAKVDSLGCELVGVSLPSEKIILNGSTNFEFASSILTDNAKKILSELALTMKENPETFWRIEGYTDNIGPYIANKKLSLERAKSVFIYLLSQGLDKERFEIYGMGPENPIGDNKIEFGRSLNRRVEIIHDNTPLSKSGIKKAVIKNANYDYSKDRIADNTIFTDGNLFTIQISSWETIEKATAEVEKLRTKGFNSILFQSKPLKDNKIWFRVRIGYFNSLGAAKNYVREYFGNK